MSIVGRNGAQFALRMPDDLRERLRRRAEKNARSMNSEAVLILASALEGEPLGEPQPETKTAGQQA